jgi:hypothetical protein
MAAARTGSGELLLNLVEDDNVSLGSLLASPALDESRGDCLHNSAVCSSLADFSVAELLNQTCTFLDNLGVSFEPGGDIRLRRLGSTIC